jgi:hypothetical protein
MAFIASTSAQLGLDLWIDINACCISNSFSTQDLSDYLDAYTKYIVQTAQMAEKYGVKSMMLNWGAWYIDFTQYGDLYPTKMLAALAQVRNVYHGKVRLYDTGAGAIKGMFVTLYKSVDVIQAATNDTGIVTVEENTNLSLELLKQKYRRIFAMMAQRYAPFPSQALSIYNLIQSHRNFFQTGWIEEAFCVRGCVQQTLQTDFSVQAMGYEAMFEAAMESGLKFYSFDTVNYWYTDIILPKDSFPNTGQSVRNKPAEVVLQRWYHK